MDDGNNDEEKPNLKGDRLNFVLLICLYTLQYAVPAFPYAISFVLQKRNVSYQDQAELSFVHYSFAFKILWAPIVDSVHSRKIGRRKSWLIPTQYLIGFLLLLLSLNVDDWLGSEDGTKKPNVRLLTVTFFTCCFLASTQDIAVDAWSLTVLQKKNIGYASICQSVGGVFGYLLAFVGFTLLDSKDFCNNFRSVPQNHGFVTFANFIFFFSMLFFVITTIILVLKKENAIDDGRKSNIGQTYALLWKLLKMRPFQIIFLFLLTCWVGFAPTRTVLFLKLIDAGVPRDEFAKMTIPSMPLKLILPFLLSRHLTGPRPMRIFPVYYVLKLINNAVYLSFMFLIYHSKTKNNALPSWYYWPLLVIYNFDYLIGFVMVLTLQAFFIRISDPRFGGVYMALLNCMANIGFMWMSTLCLWLVEPITVRSCSFDDAKGASTCETIFDGFYTEIIVCSLFGLVWLIWGVKQIHKLQKLDSSAYVLQRKSASTTRCSESAAVILTTHQ